MPMDIADYALIGDCETAALVGRDGSIDWLCWPRFDSEACFAALLGTPESGRWLISPAQTAKVTTTRRYRGMTLVLETTFETPEGAASLIDFMPIRTGASDLVRRVVGRRGRLCMRSELLLRFGYGRLVPWLKQIDGSTIEAVRGPHAVVLKCDIEQAVDRANVVSEFELEAGHTADFVLTYRPSHLGAPEPVDVGAALAGTEEEWRRWSSQCQAPKPWQEQVTRSLVTIKALTYRPTGGIIAAPTTSLPERAEGDRNWDYRYCWLRDATFALLALVQAGYREEAAAWRDWLLRAVAGDPGAVQPIYGVRGEDDLPERELSWLGGFRGAQPVRIGNRAAEQLQLDVFGEVLDVMQQCREIGLPPEEASWALQRAFVEFLEQRWREPDSGIWESRAAPEHFTHSKVMAWTALDRAVREAETHGLAAPLERWKRLRRTMHETICRSGFDSERGSFVRSFGSKELDASLLVLPEVGFLPATDRRMLGTVAAIERELMLDGFILRYRSDRVSDGLPAGEGAFVACTFWYADCLAMQGRRGEARSVFERAIGVANDVGLIAEEYDPRTGRMLGNFPQALSHLSLVNTAYNIASSTGPAHRRSGEEEGRPAEAAAEDDEPR